MKKPAPMAVGAGPGEATTTAEGYDMQTTTSLIPIKGRLTLDDLEKLAFEYGGTIERNIAAGTYRLVGAVVDGRTVTLGPVAA